MPNYIRGNSMLTFLTMLSICTIAWQGFSTYAYLRRYIMSLFWHKLYVCSNPVDTISGASRFIYCCLFAKAAKCKPTRQSFLLKLINQVLSFYGLYQARYVGNRRQATTIKFYELSDNIKPIAHCGCVITVFFV